MTNIATVDELCQQPKSITVVFYGDLQDKNAQRFFGLGLKFDIQTWKIHSSCYFM